MANVFYKSCLHGRENSRSSNRLKVREGGGEAPSQSFLNMHRYTMQQIKAEYGISNVVNFMRIEI